MIRGSHTTKWARSSWPNVRFPSYPPVIIDSGTTQILLPSNIAGIVNGLFNPPSKYIAEKGSFYVECKAIPPQFGVAIGNQTFWIDPDDMILLSEIDDETGLCLTSVQSGGEGPYILGLAFLQNVIAVFDVGAVEMRFAAHEY